MSDKKTEEGASAPLIMRADYRAEQLQAIYTLVFAAIKPEGKSFTYQIANLARLILETATKWDSGDVVDPIVEINKALLEIQAEREKRIEAEPPTR
jgi:hypothetical protein